MLQQIFARPIAHRGHHDVANGIAENAKSAFVSAIANRYSIECDLQLTGDNQAIVFHDEKLDRLTPHSGHVADISMGQATRIPLKESIEGDHIMSFAQLLEFVNGRVPLIVELKTQGTRNKKLAEAVHATAKDYLGILCFKSFDPDLIRHLHRLKDKWPKGIVVERETPPGQTAWIGFRLRHLLHFPLSRPDFVSCDVDSLDLPAVRAFRASGRKVMSWTIDTPARWEKAMAEADQIVFEDVNPRTGRARSKENPAL
ncbi:glycerophosphodiester phosphodiesterase family protein [Maritalea mediterranea]|uniref:Glycerophosphodiester phosphodiesterase n=1 Tax=Maritalea mediterranea TaxID=2909667 RepID=A0ABS9EDD5_9HYPH|nr:glycerophosphodiester phosphodiesterase family protein [Maritalea mediterranea]MCF4099899.1 glycerophosphodiester phosphodiesterase [Maritalea mediterranea]